MRIARQFPVSWSNLPVDFVNSLSMVEPVRPDWEQQRVRSREWVAQKMLGGQE